MNDFENGEIVWAKQGGAPYWPAVVFENWEQIGGIDGLDIKIPKKGNKQRTLNKSEVVVFWLGDESVSKISSKCLTAWRQGDHDLRVEDDDGLDRAMKHAAHLVSDAPGGLVSPSKKAKGSKKARTLTSVMKDIPRLEKISEFRRVCEAPEPREAVKTEKLVAPTRFKENGKVGAIFQKVSRYPNVRNKQNPNRRVDPIPFLVLPLTGEVPCKDRHG